MNRLIFSTGNDEKFITANDACVQYGIKLEQKAVDIIEIQEENPELVAKDKATKAYEVIKQPLVITDDSWSFSGLKGFPGVYMHSINEWFSPADFLRLTLPLSDRKVTLTVYLVYIDDRQIKIFRREVQGQILKTIQGTSKHASHTIITMKGDGGQSIAEAYDKAENKSARNSAKVWHDFAKWYNAQ